jgi:hypothetical protein
VRRLSVGGMVKLVAAVFLLSDCAHYTTTAAFHVASGVISSSSSLLLGGFMHDRY